MSTCVVRQDNKVWEWKKSLHLTSLHLGVKRNAPITTLNSICWSPPGIAAPVTCQLTQTTLWKQWTRVMLPVFYGSSKNQCIVILKAGRVLIAKPCMHQVPGALAENEHELAHE